MPVTPEQIAQIQRYYHVERWRTGRQGQQTWLLLGERLTHCEGFVLWAQAVIGLTHTPEVGLGVQISQIGEAACSEEILPDVANGPLYPAFLVAPGRCYRTRLKVVVASKGQQRRREPDGITLALQHSTFKVVVQQHPRQATPGLESLDMAAQKALHACVQTEAQKDAP